MWTRTVYAALTLLVASVSAPAQAFDFAHLREEARQLGGQPFRPSTNRVPETLRNLSYDQYQSIQFRHDRALWADEGLPFRVEFFLPGSVHQNTVAINEVVEHEARRIPFSPELFVFGTNRPELPADLGYAGFKLVYRPSQFGEFAAFLGASYFRMIGKGQAFGASARGLALNTAQIGHEEFPVYRELWLRRPGAQDRELVLWSLLDSPSVAGAFQFTIVPGADTVARIKAAFFPRTAVREFGLGPLTSMFLFDQNTHPVLADFRPEVHDSNGLLMHTGKGEWLWRPLESGKMLRVNAYQDLHPRGWGLMQRNRDFELYQDLVARYETRPSVWVEPVGRWGAGAVELVQLPSDVEYNDNVVAFWVPEQPPPPGQALEVEYQLHWCTNVVTSSNLGRVLATRIGRVPGTAAGQAPKLRFVLDFDGAALAPLSEGASVEAEVSCGAGVELLRQDAVRNKENNTWRLVFEMTAPNRATDMRARLSLRGEPVTETWVYTWQP